MAVCRQLGFDVTGNSAIRSADPENHTLGLEPNMKCIGSPVAEYGHSRILGHMEPPFLRGKGRSYGVSDGTMRKSDGGFLSRLSIVTVALSVTIWPQFAIECLRRSNQQGVGHFRPKFPVAPLGVDPYDVWVCRERTPHTN